MTPLDTIAEGERLLAAYEDACEGNSGVVESDAGDAWQAWLFNNAEALLAVAQAAEKRLRYGHNDTCSAVLGIEPPHNLCSCGHDEQAAALDRLTSKETDR